MASWDPFHIVPISKRAAAVLPVTANHAEHAVASLVSLSLTYAVNIACVGLSLCATLLLTSFLLPLDSNDLQTFASAGLLNPNKTHFLSANPRGAQLDAVTAMNRHDRMLQPLWSWASVEMSSFTTSFAFPGLFSLASYFLGCLPFAFLDFIPACRKFKIQPTKQPARQGSWTNTIATTIFLQLVFPVPAMIGQEYVRGPWTYRYPGSGMCMLGCEWGATKFPVSAPSMVELCLHLTLCLVVFDAGYYVWHSLHHLSRPLYKNIHAVHHEYHAPFVWVTQYTHFCELSAVASLSMTIPIAVGCHPLTHWVWLVLIVQISIDSHTGYEFPIGIDTFLPCCGGTRHHDTHHAWPKTNFQPFFTYFDWWNKTHYEVSAFKNVEVKSGKGE